jgi:hypothetical protein
MMSLDLKRGEGLRPELELILCCARTRVDETSAGHIRALLRGGLNWSDVVATAFQHHVASFLYENLRLTGEGLVPTVWLDSMRQYARESSRLALLLLSELLRIHEIFEAEQLLLIPYKGPVLSWLAYHSLTGRTFIDLDFVLEQEHIPRATALLQSAGFSAAFEPQEALAGRSGHPPGQYGFFRGATRAQVELHTEQTLRYFPVPLDFEKLSRRLITIEIAGRKMRTFSVEDTLVMLCVHGAKHFWDRLAWIVDVAELITAQPVDWALAMQIAAEMKSTRVLLLGLYLAHEFLGAPLPQSFLERAQQDSGVRWLADKVRAQFQGDANSSPGVVPRAVFRLRSRDGIGQGMRHLLRLAMSPTERDRQTMRLPRALAPLYMLMRPLRLLREYGLGLRRRLEPDLAIFEPTPSGVVDQMLRFAEVAPGDVLYDLRCGDGALVVGAAKKHGVRAVGVDISPKRISEALANADHHGVKDQVQFLLQDAKKVDVSEATVVTLYLGTDANLGLVERLRKQLRPGARIISRNFQIPGWIPDRFETHVLPGGMQTYFYLWTINEPEEETLVTKYAAPELQPSDKRKPHPGA